MSVDHRKTTPRQNVWLRRAEDWPAIYDVLTRPGFHEGYHAALRNAPFDPGDGRERGYQLSYENGRLVAVLARANGVPTRWPNRYSVPDPLRELLLANARARKGGEKDER